MTCSGQTEGYGAGDSWGGQTPRTQLSGSAMERNVARLFSDRVKLTAAVEFTQASILAGASRPRLSCLDHIIDPAPYAMLQLSTEVHTCFSLAASAGRISES